MIVDNFYVVRVAVFPAKTDPPLIVDAYAVLPAPIAFQQLKPIARRRCKIADFRGAVELQELSPRNQLDRLKLTRTVSIE